MKNFASLFTKGKILTYKKKDFIISPLLSPKGVYRVEQGFLYGYSLTKNNQKRVQSILKPGDIFPLLQYTTDVPSRFYIEALTDATVSLVKKDVFFTQVYTNRKLTEEFIGAFSAYLRRYVDRVEVFELKTLSKKVVGRLLHFASHFGIKKGKTIYIQVPLTHEFMAESINVSRGNVSRELNKLKKEKLITFQGKHLIILNSEKLAEKI